MRTRLEADTSAAFMHAAIAGGLALGGLILTGYGVGVGEAKTSFAGAAMFLGGATAFVNRSTVALKCLKEKWAHTPG